MNKDNQDFTGLNKLTPEIIALLTKESPPWRDFGQEQGEEQTKNKKQRAIAYEADEHEIEMVNAALLLRRPLLITGKPGTGKSSLAHAVAYKLSLGEVLIWPITSKSILQHGLYNYDALARLQDVNLNVKDKTIGDYIRLGAVGTAFLKSESQKPAVVLIDEIDKSDIDLPNDLLHLFEEGEFEIPEIARLELNQPTEVYAHRSQEKLSIDKNGLIRCKSFPLVIMTSNGEREFPPAFLRRCLRLNIEKPNEDKLKNIVKQHLGIDAEKITDEQDPIKNDTLKLIGEFLELRDKKGKELATDQLLNAIYLLKSGVDLPNQDVLRKAIFTALNES